MSDNSQHDIYSSPISSGFCPLPALTLFAAQGVDAPSFLHNQLSNDIQALKANHFCLAALCSPKGRMLTNLLVLRAANEEPPTLLCQLPTELAAAIQKKLQMYVLRAKVTLASLANTHQIIGVIGQDSAQQLLPWFAVLPSQPNSAVNSEFGTLLRLNDVQQTPRYQWICEHVVAEEVLQKLNAALPTISQSAWFLSDIHAGMPRITTATQEKFVPQMINYELIGGVNFKKGCYPGQEIVARSQYLGKQKRRMLLARIAAPLVESGMAVFAPQTDIAQPDNQPCGLIVNAEPNGLGGFDCLIEIQTLIAHSGASISLASGEICHWLPMPYALPNDDATSN